MKIKILSPLWGHEQMPILTFLEKISSTGYDGIETWLPASRSDKKVLFDYLDQHNMVLVCHQHEAVGSTFKKFKVSYLENLKLCGEPQPILINSHTGKDYFSFEQNLELIDIATEFSQKTGIRIAHETHRGRLGYSPQMMEAFFEKREDFIITADFSHWTCVTESLLENFQPVLAEAIKRSRHIHARVGFEQGPQVPNPRAPEWAYALNAFSSWWDRIVEKNISLGIEILPITTEFGPPPYMPVLPFFNKPVADQFEVNLYMKDLIKKRYPAMTSN